MAASDENARELARRDEKLFSAKANLDGLNQELAYNFYPERADFTVERALGTEFAIDIFDSAPLLCRRDLGNARAAMLRPRGQQWFRAAHPDDRINEQPDVAKKLDWVNSRARTLIYQAAAGFVRAAKEADHDLVTFGGSVASAESTVTARGTRRLLVRGWHPRDCVWLDDADGVGQDYLARRFKASARHIKRKFPDAPLADPIKEAIDKDPDKEFKLCHVMMLADEYEYYKKPARAATYASVYYDSEHKMLLRERPSNRFRYVVDRWATISGSQYPYSPAALTSLPDGRGRQIMARVLYEAGEKKLDPPLKAVRRALKSEINSYAGGITWVDKDYDEKSGAAIEPLLPSDLDPGIGIELLQLNGQALKDAWYLTKLTLPAQAKTAYETQQLVEEFIRANIPLFEPWEAGTELLLSEIFAVLMDIGEFGAADGWPKALWAQDLEFKFANPLQDAIERNKVNMATTALGLLAGAAKVVPQAPGARRIDVDEMVEDAVRGSGAPADWIKDEATVAAEAQQQQTRGDIVQALHGAGMAADVVNGGLDAAQKLRDLTTQPNVAGEGAYGPT